MADAKAAKSQKNGGGSAGDGDRMAAANYRREPLLKPAGIFAVIEEIAGKNLLNSTPFPARRPGPPRMDNGSSGIATLDSLANDFWILPALPQHRIAVSRLDQTHRCSCINAPGLERKFGGTKLRAPITVPSGTWFLRHDDAVGSDSVNRSRVTSPVMIFSFTAPHDSGRIVITS